jgi:hypothetical protein
LENIFEKSKVLSNLFSGFFQDGAKGRGANCQLVSVLTILPSPNQGKAKWLNL